MEEDRGLRGTTAEGTLRVGTIGDGLVGVGFGVEVEIGRGGGGAFLVEEEEGDAPFVVDRIDATDEGRLSGLGPVGVVAAAAADADLRSGLEVFVDILEADERTLFRVEGVEAGDDSRGGAGGGVALTGDLDIADAAAGGLRWTLAGGEAGRAGRGGVEVFWGGRAVDFVEAATERVEVVDIAEVVRWRGGIGLLAAGSFGTGVDGEGVVAGALRRVEAVDRTDDATEGGREVGRVWEDVTVLLRPDSEEVEVAGDGDDEDESGVVLEEML